MTAEYNGAPESERRIALVGKGICFDSGGYCLKGGEMIASILLLSAILCRERLARSF
ncbi:MAG: leucyl aminopeptidase family protein [Clostridiales bacterium]|nr:leucyl aminopeptidase family protein [Clostridiales bacterium]